MSDSDRETFHIQAKSTDLYLETCPNGRCPGKMEKVNGRHGEQIVINNGGYVLVIDPMLEFSRSIQDGSAIDVWFGECSKI